MAIIRCRMGHFYDDGMDAECPMCKQVKNARRDGRYNDWHEQETVSGFSLSGRQEKTIFLDMYQKSQKDSEKTIGFYSKLKGNDFVTGWLVCVEGPEKGRDYRLYHGFNQLGRGMDMDIFVGEDPEISREGHCSIVYDGKNNQFFLMPSKGNLVYKNGNMMQSAEKLETGDQFVVGGSKFEFIAFCREGHTWGHG